MLFSDVDDDDDGEEKDDDDDEEPDSLVVVIIRRGRAPVVIAVLGSTTRRVDGGGAVRGKDRAPRWGADPRRDARPRAAAAMSRPSSTMIPLLFVRFILSCLL